jgi:hypothetical protein
VGKAVWADLKKPGLKRSTLVPGLDPTVNLMFTFSQV